MHLIKLCEKSKCKCQIVFQISVNCSYIKFYGYVIWLAHTGGALNLGIVTQVSSIEVGPVQPVQPVIWLDLHL